MYLLKTLASSMYLLKSLSIAHNAIFHVLYRFYLILQITLLVVLLSFPLSYANEHGATIFTVPVATESFSYGQEVLETLLHHKTGLKEPRVYKDQALQYCKNAMQLTPNWLKTHYGTLPLSSVRAESATQVQRVPYSLSQAIKLIKSDACQDDVSFVSVLDKKIAHTLKTCNQLSSLPFLGTKKSSINFLEFESFLYSLNYEGKQVPITLPISFSRWKKMFPHHTSAEKKKRYKDIKTKRQLSCMHKKFQSTFDKTSLTLPTYITFLEVSNKHHVEHLHQNMIHVSSVIVQTHGRQKVVLMPPISEQHPHPHWLDLTGQFFLNKEIDLSASDSILNNESRLAHATLYSVHLNPGDMLLVPANWFIYRKSLSTSVSLSLNYLSGDQWRLFCSQAEPMEQKHEHEYPTLEKRAITEWADMEMQQNPRNEYNIIRACKNIQAAISDATQQVLDLSRLQLRSLPNAIFRIPHLETLNLAHNLLTSFSWNHAKNLVSLDLAHNQLTSFAFSHTKSLTSLDLEHNQLTFFSLSYTTKLASLNLAHNLLTSFSLIYAEELSSLNLAHNHLTSFFLGYAEKLTSLNVTRNELTSFSLSYIQNLALLDLSNNQLYTFLSCNLPSATHINLSHNNLSHLDPSCISSINNNQFIKLDLRNNPLSNEGITQIQEDLLQRPGNNTTYYPFLHPLIEHINNNTMTYQDFIDLLSFHKIFPPSENNCLICPITCTNPSQVIFCMSSNKCYKIYDADALIKWICTQSQSEEFSKKIKNPYTREPLTLNNIMSAKEPCVLQYFKQKLGSVFTENIDMIHEHKS